MRIDAASELTHLVEMLIEDAMKTCDVDAQVAVYECVTEACEGSQATRKLQGQDPEPAQLVDGRRIVRRIAPGARTKMRCYVENALRKPRSTAQRSSRSRSITPASRPA